MGIQFEFILDGGELEGIKIVKIYENKPASQSKLIVGDIIQIDNEKKLTRENTI